MFGGGKTNELMGGKTNELMGHGSTTVLALLFKGRYFHEFHEKVAFRENIIVNSCASVALLHLKQSAS